jgi:chemotaxis protein MotB
MIRFKNTIYISAIALLAACVPAKHLDEAKGKLANCETELSDLKKTSQVNNAKLEELKEQVAKNEKTINSLKNDTSSNGSALRGLNERYNKTHDLNLQLSDKLNKLIAGSDKEQAKLSKDLQLTREELLRKEDTLRVLATKLNKQKTDLDNLTVELKSREARVAELEDILKKKEQAAADLRKKLSDALIGFENKGLTITQRNGKVYVSLDESLLFASGKTNVEEKGVEALKHVAKVLEQNPDINVMVEGHTDDVAMKGAGEIKDNWDLSVMRATSVTKIMLNSAKIDAQRITSAGRGEFSPLDKGKTPEARKKNRRTEIILTPKLDELLKVLGSN